MFIYSKKILEDENGFVIKNYNMVKIILFTFMIFILTFWISLHIYLIVNENIMDINGWDCFALVFVLSFYSLLCYYIINYIKGIFINTKDKEIIFKYRLLPINNKKKIKFNNIKEILINHNQNLIFSMPNKFQTIEKIYIYSAYIIDNDQNAYRIYKSEVYNDEIINFSKKIGEIININVSDQNDIEFDKKIYKLVI